MSISIKSPRHDVTSRDYKTECEAALELSLSEIIDAATVAGWSPPYVFTALQVLIARQQFAYDRDPDPADDPIDLR